jgi:hypothetical protein
MTKTRDTAAVVGILVVLVILFAIGALAQGWGIMIVAEILFEQGIIGGSLGFWQSVSIGLIGWAVVSSWVRAGVTGGNSK